MQQDVCVGVCRWPLSPEEGDLSPEARIKVVVSLTIWLLEMELLSLYESSVCSELVNHL